MLGKTRKSPGFFQKSKFGVEKINRQTREWKNTYTYDASVEVLAVVKRSGYLSCCDLSGRSGRCRKKLISRSTSNLSHAMNFKLVILGCLTVISGVASSLHAQSEYQSFPVSYTMGDSVPVSQPDACSQCEEIFVPPVVSPSAAMEQSETRSRRRGGPFGKEANDDACASSHKGFNYLNDYSYLDDSEYDGKCIGDSLKRLGKSSKDDKTWIDVGGRFRLRYHHEDGLAREAGSGFLDGNTTDHLLGQIRLFADARLGDRVRVFAEGIYADVVASTDGYRARGNERNRGDALNLFVDFMPTDNTTLRLGRQQMLYGSRRIIAGPGWANTSRSHDGVKLIQKFDNFQVDLFYVQRVPVTVDGFDESDFDRAVYGLWTTYTFDNDDLIDLYYIGIDDDVAGAEKQLHTVGGRLFGGDKLLYDIEGAAQFGKQEALGVDHAAAFSTMGLGRNFSNLPWKPTLWAYYDFATGDTPGGAFNRYDSIFNRRHHYLGFIDLAQRRNIEIPSLQLSMKPDKRLSLSARYFHINANQGSDNILPLGGGLVPQDSTIKNYGDTYDLQAKLKISSRSDARIGYAKFLRDDRVIATENASLLYAEWAVWF